jgi:hypothetical protein
MPISAPTIATEKCIEGKAFWAAIVVEAFVPNAFLFDLGA